MSLVRIPTGVAGLDEILNGGLVAGQTYLVRGGPGTGKTTLGLHFLTAGAQRGERVLFISLGQPEAAIRANAASMGFDLSQVNFLDLSPSIEFFVQVESYDIFTPAEVEREPTTQSIVETIERIKPQRVFLDSMTQFRYLSTDLFQFRKQSLSFLRFVIEQGATVLFSSEGCPQSPDDDLMFLADGVIYLELNDQGRTLSVTKYRGSSFRVGRHAMSLGDRGMEVWPKLMPAEHQRDFSPDVISSGVTELDQMLHGGIERGAITLLTGPSGVGKTTLGMLFMKEAAARGERSVIFCFEEELTTLLYRCKQVNIPASEMIEAGVLSVIKVEPLALSADQFAMMVRAEVEQRNVRIVMLDSISGYRLALRGEDVVSHMHALGKYLVRMGVAVLLINEVEYITGEFRATEVGVSYLADNLIFLRYIEAQGAIRRVIGVLKKRTSDFEKTMREFAITSQGITLGQPLTNLRGILNGIPGCLP